MSRTVSTDWSTVNMFGDLKILDDVASIQELKMWTTQDRSNRFQHRLWVDSNISKLTEDDRRNVIKSATEALQHVIRLPVLPILWLQDKRIVLHTIQYILHYLIILDKDTDYLIYLGTHDYIREDRSLKEWSRFYEERF